MARTHPQRVVGAPRASRRPASFSHHRQETEDPVSNFFRTGYTSFQEFQREALSGPYSHHESLGKEELELLEELEADELFDVAPRRNRRKGLNRWE